MAKRIVIDPVTRIEGHLRVEVEVENGKVVDAWTKGTMFRGIEQILQGRDPRDAIYITERVCGVCVAAHGWTSAVAVEKASNAEVPYAARLIRNLLSGAMFLHDHVLHFYHLSVLDYLDISAIKNYQGNDYNILNIRNKILSLVEAGDAYPLLPSYEPDDFSIRDPEIVNTALAHYVQALQIQAKARRLSAILGGKQPHQSNIVAGGVTGYPTIEQLKSFRNLLLEIRNFIKLVYLPDVINLATGPLLPLAQAGLGKGVGNYLAYGGFAGDEAGQDNLFQAGVVFNKREANVENIDIDKITEDVTNAWYRNSAPASPWEGKTDVDLDKEGAYTFIKSPRYNGIPMEVGSLARMIINQHEPFAKITEKYSMQYGAVTRHLARAQETVLMADTMLTWLNDLEKLLNDNERVDIHNSQAWEPVEKGRGVGLQEAPRGALGHWIEIENHKIKNYQMVVPTTWNISPRDYKGSLGPMEKALIGLPVDEKNPLNIVRVIRSFDPCLACAVHVISPKGDNFIHL